MSAAIETSEQARAQKVDPEADTVLRRARSLIDLVIIPAGGPLAERLQTVPLTISHNPSADQNSVSLSAAPESRIFLTYNQKAPAAPQIALETSAELLESGVRLLSVADRKLAGRTATDLEFETIENLKRVGAYLEKSSTFSPEAQRTHTNQLVQGVREIEAAYHARLQLRPTEVISAFLLTSDNALTPFLKSLTSGNVLRVQVEPNLRRTGVVNEVDEQGQRSIVLSFQDENLNSLPKGIASTVQSLTAASLTHGKGVPKESDVRIQSLRILDQLLEVFGKKHGPQSDLLPVLTEARRLIETKALDQKP